MSEETYDNDAKIRQAISLLTKIVNDTNAPRNIRRAAYGCGEAVTRSELKPCCESS